MSLSSFPVLLASLYAFIGAPVFDGSETLQVDVVGLHQCAYGVGYRRPLRAELILNEEVVARSDFGGTYYGNASLRMSLYLTNARAARYRLRVGACPDLVDDPAASVACDDAETDWLFDRQLRLAPRAGSQAWEVRIRHQDAVCMP